VIEARVVSHEQPAVEAREKILGEDVEGWRVAHHRVVDSGELLNEKRNGLLRIDERTPLRHARWPDFDHANFSNSMNTQAATRCFQVDKNQRLGGKEIGKVWEQGR